MSNQTVCIPLSPTGTVDGRLGQASAVVLCQVDDGDITRWQEVTVDWAQDYGVDVPGVHHPRVIRFLQSHQVTAVVADQVCEVMQETLPKLGIAVRSGFSGDPRSALVDALAA